MIEKQLNIFVLFYHFFTNFPYFYWKIIKVSHLNPLVPPSIATLLHGIGTSSHHIGSILYFLTLCQTNLSEKTIFNISLDASMHLYKRLCPSVRHGAIVLKSPKKGIHEIQADITKLSLLKPVYSSNGDWSGPIFKPIEIQAKAFTIYIFILFTMYNEWLDEWMNEWMNKWMNVCINEGMNEWKNEWLNEWMNERNEWMNVNERMSVWISESMNQWTSEWMNEWVNEWTSEWMNKWMSDWMNEWFHECEWMNVWMNVWINERMNEWMKKWIYEQVIEWVRSRVGVIPRANENEIKEGYVSEWLYELVLETSLVFLFFFFLLNL